MKTCSDRGIQTRRTRAARCMRCLRRSPQSPSVAASATQATTTHRARRSSGAADNYDAASRHSPLYSDINSFSDPHWFLEMTPIRHRRGFGPRYPRATRKLAPIFKVFKSLVRGEGYRAPHRPTCDRPTIVGKSMTLGEDGSARQQSGGRVCRLW